jgi:hypothetical protein
VSEQVRRKLKVAMQENARLQDKIDLITPPIWLRVVAWLVSFVGAFWLTEIILNWMHR